MLYPNPEKYIIQMKEYYNTGKTKPYEERINNLNKLRKMIHTNEEQILKALKKDLGKSNFEGYVTEIGIVLEEITYAIKHLKKWMKAHKVMTPISQFGSKAYIYVEPKGMVLILAPWNYPFSLVMGPLIGAIAAGNVVLIKTSKESPTVSELIGKMIEQTFNKNHIYYINGGYDITDQIIELGVDHIFFTGSPKTGKLMMEKASYNLTSITLELGGQNPAIVHKDANINKAAERIVWGKFINTGQTCLAPNHVYVHKEILEKFQLVLVEKIKEFYGENPQESKSYGKIINEKQFDRIIEYLDEIKIIYGGKYNREELYIEPTLMSQITEYDKVMKDEIFGPILPIIEYENLDDLIKELRDKDKPLATYIFTENNQIGEKVINRLSFGGGCINDTLSHVGNTRLPFGGIGNSGMGSYHGKAGFDTFSHYKSILKKSRILNIKLAYPPYTADKLKWIKKVLK